MKRFLVLLVILFWAQSSPAGPIDWLKHHPLATKFIFAGASAGVHAYGLHHCREVNVEICDGKYGAAWGIFGAATATNLVIILVSDKIGGAEGSLIGYTGSAIQLGHGVYEWRKSETHVDMSSVVLVHH